MFLHLPRGKSVLFLGLVLALGVVGVQFALAVPPPPPKLLEFQVINNIGADVNDINIKLLAGHNTGTWSTSYGATDSLDEYAVFIKKLPPGHTHVISIPSLRCVARIEVTANCPGPMSNGPVAIDADSGDFDPAHPGSEWCGFTKEMPTGGTAPFNVTFAMVGGAKTVTLTGLSRWGNTSAQKTQSRTFP